MILAVQKDVVSTSHCSQPNNIEYDMGIEWCLLQERANKSWRMLYQVFNFWIMWQKSLPFLFYLLHVDFFFIMFLFLKRQGGELSKLTAKLKSKIFVGKFSFKESFLASSVSIFYSAGCFFDWYHFCSSQHFLAYAFDFWFLELMKL